MLAFRADLNYDIEAFGQPASLKAGGKFQKRERSVDQNRFNIDIDDAMFDADGDGIVTIADFNPGIPENTDLNTGFFPDPALLQPVAFEAAEAGRAAGNFSEIFAENNGNDYSVREEVYSAFAMGKFSFTDDMQVIAGVRMESTEWRTNGNRTDVVSYDADASEVLADALDESLENGTATFTQAERDAFLAARFDDEGEAVEDVGSVVPFESENSYTDFFPSVNIRWDITNKLLARLSYTTATRRPDFNQAAALVTIQTGDETDEDDIEEFVEENGGITTLAQAASLIEFERNFDDLRDPLLEPLYAHQFDASIAWYPTKDTFFQVAGFYKKISNFIVPIVFSGSDLALLGITVGELDNNRTATINGGFNSAETFINGDTAEVYGVEISASQNFTFLPGLLRGLFVAGNLTLSDSKATDAQIGREFTLPDQSNSSWNLSAGYEDEFVSLRWSGNYTGERLLALNAGFLGLEDPRSDLLERPRFSMDVNVRLNLSDRFQIYLDALNINDAEDRQFFRGDPDGAGPIFAVIENYGPTYQAGVRLKF